MGSLASPAYFLTGRRARWGLLSARIALGCAFALPVHAGNVRPAEVLGPPELPTSAIPAAQFTAALAAQLSAESAPGARIILAHLTITSPQAAPAEKAAAAAIIATAAQP